MDWSFCSIRDSFSVTSSSTGAVDVIHRWSEAVD